MPVRPLKLIQAYDVSKTYIKGLKKDYMERVLGTPQWLQWVLNRFVPHTLNLIISNTNTHFVSKEIYSFHRTELRLRLGNNQRCIIL